MADFSKQLAKVSSCLIGAIIFGFGTVVNCLSFSTLLFGSKLHPLYAIGLACMLVGAIFITVVTSIFTSQPTIIAQPQDEPLPIYLLMIASISSMLGAEHSNLSTIFSTVMCAIVISTILTGVVFYLMGLFKLGNIASFIPYPVIGGFMAGIGWLLFIAAIHMLTELPVTLTNVAQLFQHENLLKWGIAFIFAFLLLLATQYSFSIYIFGGFILGGIILFYLTIYFLHIPLSTLETNKFILLISNQDTFSSLHYLSFKHIDWHLILLQAPHIAILIMLCVILILLRVVSLEVNLKQEMNINHELRVTGFANILSGLFGGIVGYHTINNSIINDRFQHKHHLRSRSVGYLTGIVCLFFLLFGISPVGYVPLFVSGGLLMYFAMSFIQQWMINTWHRLPLFDYLIIVVIFILTALYGVMIGVLTGIIIAFLLFTLRYSKITSIKLMLSGLHLYSSKQYLPKIQQALQKYGDQLLYVRMQNYLFFGNMSYLINKLKDKIATTDNKINYIIFDFNEVTGMDSSGLAGFEKLNTLLQKEKIETIYTGLNPLMLTLFKNTQLISESNPHMHIFANYDLGLQWYEAQVIKNCNLQIKNTLTLEERLNDYQFKGDLRVLTSYFEKMTLKKDGVLFKKGEQTGPLFYIESGYLAVYLEHEVKNSMPVRTLGPGNTVGEIAFYLDKPRTATVIAQESSVLRVISRESMQKLCESDPQLAIYFQRFIIFIFAERIEYANYQTMI